MTGPRVIACSVFPRDVGSPRHDLVRAFRAGDEPAFAAVAALVSDGLAREAPELDRDAGVVAVPMPGHRTATGSAPLERLAALLASDHPGWSAMPGALNRVENAPEGKAGGPRDPAAEAATLRWSKVPGKGPVLLLDDVMRSGATLDAAALAAPPAIRARLVALVAFRAVA